MTDRTTNTGFKYDFTSILDRKGHDALAVDAIGDPSIKMAPGAPSPGFDLIPMWVADMNFPVLPDIQRHIIDRVNHPAFGYYMPRDEYYDRIIRWHRVRNGVESLTKECIGYENGVLGGLASALRVFCPDGGKVLLHSPTYIGFTGTLKNNGYEIVSSPLVRDAQGIFRMDLADMEEKFRKGDIPAMIFCSPHNPTGRVWEEEEIRAVTELCRKYDVKIVSDEIWSDIILAGHQHIPTQSVSEDAKGRTVALYAPSKTFNLAGLIGSYHIIYDPDIRKKVRKQSSLSHYNDMNVLSMHALIGAYSDNGMVWVDELRQVIQRNVDFASDFIEKNFDGVSVTKPDGTYMLWVDCGQWCRDHGRDLQTVEEACWKVGAAVQDGRMFHGPSHLRMNLALPYSRVTEAFERMRKYVF